MDTHTCHVRFVGRPDSTDVETQTDPCAGLPSLATFLAEEDPDMVMHRLALCCCATSMLASMRASVYLPACATINH